MNLFQRLLIAPAAALLLMLMLGGIAYQSLKSQQQSLDDLANQRIGSIAAVADMRANVLRTHAGVYRIFTWTGTQNDDYLEKEAKILLATFDTHLPNFSQWASNNKLSEEEKKIAKEITAITIAYRKTAADALDMASVDMNSGITMMQTADEKFKLLSSAIDQLIDHEKKLSGDAQNEADSAYKRTVSVIVGSLILAIAATGIISFLMARAIAAQVRAATRLAGSVAQGNLSNVIPPAGKDEIGALLIALDQMQSGLRSVVSELGSNATHLDSASGTMRDSSQSISQAVRRQSDSIAGTAAAIEEMHASIGQVSDNAESARLVAQRTAEIAQTGKQLVANASAEIHKIAGTVKVTAAAMHDLQSSSLAISNIANVIRDIADQTNLLALNAAIEAARAGEAGRGFAVVADEVRKLAEKTAVATSEIKSMIEQIQKESNQATSQMEAASGQVASGVELIGNLQAPLDELHDCSRQALGALVELADAVREQQEGSLQITRNVETIAHESEATSHNAENGLTIAKDLATTAETLQSLVGRFRT